MRSDTTKPRKGTLTSIWTLSSSEASTFSTPTATTIKIQPRGPFTFIRRFNCEFLAFSLIKPQRAISRVCSRPERISQWAPENLHNQFLRRTEEPTSFLEGFHHGRGAFCVKCFNEVKRIVIKRNNFHTTTWQCAFLGLLVDCLIKRTFGSSRQLFARFNLPRRDERAPFAAGELSARVSRCGKAFSAYHRRRMSWRFALLYLD